MRYEGIHTSRSPIWEAAFAAEPDEAGRCFCVGFALCLGHVAVPAYRAAAVVQRKEETSGDIEVPRQIIDRITHPSRSPAPSPFLLGPKQSEASSSSRGTLLQDPLTSCNFVLPPRPRGRQPACSQSRQLPCLRACRIRYSNLPLLPSPPLPSQKLPKPAAATAAPSAGKGSRSHS